MNQPQSTSTQPQLRFLAEDVGKELDLVLDTILRALNSRRVGRSANRVINVSRAN